MRTDGRYAQHGLRGHYAPGSATYQRFCRLIALEMGRRFGHHPNVIGWQIDNEFWSVSQDPESLELFRKWLRDRYSSLEALNTAWSGAYWSEDYFAWDDIQAANEGSNPGLKLAWRRFNSDLYAGYQRVQIEALREVVESRQWITHNFHPHDDLNREVISRDLDFACWDAYILNYGVTLDPGLNGADVDRIRGLKRRNLWIMETQPGNVNWRKVNNVQAPGAMRSMAWHMVGHGADAVLYWQWRSAPGGQEQYHGSILGPDGEPRPRYAEIARIGAEFKALSPEIDGSESRNPVAVIDRWQDRFPLRWQPHHQEFSPVTHVQTYYKAVQRFGQGTDVLEKVETLAGYRVVIAPHLHLATPSAIAELTRFVEAGGHLVMGMRSCFRDEESALYPARQPGPLAKLLGASVRDHYALEAPVAIAGDLGQGVVGIFAEDLETQADDVQVWMRYGDQAGWLADRPAVVHRRLGAGSFTYCGCQLPPDLADVLVRRIFAQAEVKPLLAVPEGVEVTARYKADRQYLFVVNHAAKAQSIKLPVPRYDLISKNHVTEPLTLPAYGVAVLV